jgi:hypothetical protein
MGEIKRGKLLDGRVTALNVVAVLTNKETGEKRVIEGGNIVTNNGDLYYARAAAKGILGVETLPFTVVNMRLGYNAGTAGAPQKTDTSMLTSTGSTPFESIAIDSGYPKTNDTDPNNPGAAVDTISWRTSFTTAQANHANIATLELLPAAPHESECPCVANFAAKFEKTSADTLQVYVNHNVLGA